jgi:hypothetical protein
MEIALNVTSPNAVAAAIAPTEGVIKIVHTKFLIRSSGDTLTGRDSVDTLSDTQVKLP